MLKFNNAKRFLRCQALEIIKIHSSWILNADTPGSTAGKEEAVKCGESNSGLFAQAWLESGLYDRERSNAWHGSKEGAQNNYYYNMQQKGEGERELG